MLFTQNIGSAFINAKRQCAPIQQAFDIEAPRLTSEQTTAYLSKLDRCINAHSENKQAAQRTLLLIGGVAALGAYFMFFRKK